MSVTLSKSGPGLRGLSLSLKQIRKSEVLVGIPAQNTLRSNEPINNASLLFVLSKGSDLAGIPPAPVLEPSIVANKELIAPLLAAAAQAVFAKDPHRAQMELERAGTVAANGAKRWFVDPRNNWPPNAPYTIRKKGSDKRNIDTGSMRRAITSVVIQGK